jgi:hypothetical protein
MSMEFPNQQHPPAIQRMVRVVMDMLHGIKNHSAGYKTTAP